MTGISWQRSDPNGREEAVVNESQDPGSMSIAEVRHRTANVFQLLTTLGRLRAQRGDDAEARRQVEWLHDATSALGVLQHRQLGPGGDDFAGFLEEMAPFWRRRAGARPVVIELAAEPVILPEQSAAALAVITQELVANALAHAFPDGRAGAVRIELARLEAGRARLSVADDGAGYDAAATDPRRLGLWLIGGLADQVKGVLTTTTGAGVQVRLEFPSG
jgi:two-component sensor histidine kinase